MQHGRNLVRLATHACCATRLCDLELSASPHEARMAGEVNHKWSADACRRCGLRRKKAGSAFEFEVKGAWLKQRDVPPCDDRPKFERVALPSRDGN